MYCKDFMADCICFISYKVVFEKMIDLDGLKVVFVVKIIDLNVKMSTKKTMVAFIFEINGDNSYMA